MARPRKITPMSKGQQDWWDEDAREHNEMARRLARSPSAVDLFPDGDPGVKLDKDGVPIEHGEEVPTANEGDEEEGEGDDDEDDPGEVENANPEGYNQYSHSVAKGLVDHLLTKLHDPQQFRSQWADMEDSDKVAVVKALAKRDAVHPLDARKKKPMTASEVITSAQAQIKKVREDHEQQPLNRHVPFSESEAYKKLTAE